MKKIHIVLISLLFTGSVFGQFDEAADQLRTQNTDTIMGGNLVGSSIWIFHKQDLLIGPPVVIIR